MTQAQSLLTTRRPHPSPPPSPVVTGPCRAWVWAALLLLVQSAVAEARCGSWQATVVEAEGVVELRPNGTNRWQAVSRDDTICLGDAMRVMSYSRAAVQLPDDVLLRLHEHSTVVFSPREDESGSRLINILKGLIHVISRGDPRSLTFNTPFVNAGLEGTEFVLAVGDERTDVTVVEGRVLLSNSAGQVGVPSGAQGVARTGQAPTFATVERPMDAARWTHYYPPILASARLPAPSHAPQPAERDAPSFYSRRAAAHLRTGRLAPAEDDLRTALHLEPSHAEALALQSVIMLAQQDRDTAMSLAHRAVDADPGSTAALIALSHAKQAHFDLAGARDALERAVAQEAGNAIAWARLAETELALGHVSAGTVAARTAIGLDPSLGQAHAVLGFAHLMAPQEQNAAANAFQQAIALDQAAPLPRLGLGLALSRQRQPADSRAQIELAVLLDPANALARSYMAKAYHDEHRDELTASQLELARTFDPLDPTPWLYDALHKHSRNRPIEALRDWRHASELNANQPVYRSRLTVDEDLPARSAPLGRLHKELGFEQLALLEGWRSTIEEPGEHSGHRLLADVYSTLPRHEVGRINELHQSQLLQPLNVTPIPPQLAEVSQFILDSAGPTDLAFSEFSPLLGGRGVGFEASAVGAGAGTSGESLVLAGSHDRTAYSVGHLGFRTDGFRANNDLDQRITNAFVQFRPDPDTGVLAELRTTRTDKGDLRMLFNPTGYDRQLRQEEAADSVRVGFRRRLSERSQLLVTGLYDQVAASADTTVAVSSELEGLALEVQHLYRGGDQWRMTSGLRYSNRQLDQRTTFPDSLPVIHTRARLSHLSAYGYSHVPLGDALNVTIGGSIDSLQGQVASREAQFNPKLGLTWNATSATIVRAGTVRTLQGPAISRHHLRPWLEPTHVAGFNQFFFGPEGEDAWRHGVGIDHRLSADLHAGANFTIARLQTPVAVVRTPTTGPATEYSDVSEAAHRAYVYWTPTRSLSVSAEYHYEQVDNDGAVLAHGFSKLTTHRTPLRLGYFHSSGVSAGVKATFADQRGTFPLSPGNPAAGLRHGTDRFWVLDLSLGYRLPRRRGLLALNVHNALDRDFRFQDADPENPRIIPQRMVSLRFTVAH